MKKLIKIAGVLVCIAVLFLNVSFNRGETSVNVNLSKLVVTNHADAECIPINDNTWMVGVCWALECGIPVPPWESPNCTYQ